MSAKSEDPSALTREITKLRKINASLMSRLERSGAETRTPFALFENAATLDQQVRHQTQDLREALHMLERSNDALQQAKEVAEAANALKTSFLASISHDLLQPLHAARLMLAVLDEKLATPDAPKMLHQADRSLHTLEDIITTLLDISKLDAGVLKPQMRAVATGDLIEELCLEFAPIAQARALVLRKRITNATVQTDPLFLRRILQNLLSNALRYTKSGGVLLLCRRQDNALRFDIADTGPGIPSHRQSAIFEEFQRDDVGIKGEPGSGLGLSIVKRLAAAMDHEIALWSRIGRGSVFSVFVPLAAETSAPSLAPASFLPFASAQIMIRRFGTDASDVARLLESWGSQIVVADDYDAAERHLLEADRLPDLLVLCADDNVQGVSSELAKLRSLAGQQLPAFIITKDNPSVQACDGIETLSSPVRPAELRALVTYLLREANS